MESVTECIFSECFYGLLCCGICAAACKDTPQVQPPLAKQHASPLTVITPDIARQEDNILNGASKTGFTSPN